MNKTVRYATKSDVNTIKKIADANTKELGFINKARLTDSIDKNECIVALLDDHIVGFALFHRRLDGVTTLYELCTDSRARMKGVATSLIKEIPKPIHLKCPSDNESNHFYNAKGFKYKGIEKGKKRMLNIWVLEE